MRRERFVHAVRRTEGKLPHIEEPGQTYFVTMNLARPAVVDLTEQRVGSVVQDALTYYDGVRYDLMDYTVMPDHVHWIIRPLAENGVTYALDVLLFERKHWIAVKINRLVGRRGHLWQAESHDHIIRNREDYEEKAQYIFWNSHEAGLIDDPAKWPWWGRGQGCR